MEWITDLLTSMISAGTPLLLATLGEIYAERSGILNLGVEGMMAVGAVTAFAITLASGNPLLGFLLAALTGCLLACVHAFLSISIRSNQVISGLALTMLGLGISALAGRRLIGTPLPVSIRRIPVPLLSDTPVIGAFFNQDPVTYASYVLVVLLWFILFKTKLGVIIRACGENPQAVHAAGIDVYLIRYLCTLIGGALAGLSGAYLSVVYTPTWIEGMTAGQGWIAIALVIFAVWNPIYATVGAYLFGGIRILQYRLQPLGISVPLLKTLPYVCTIIVLVVASSGKFRKKIGAPAALAIPFEK